MIDSSAILIIATENNDVQISIPMFEFSESFKLQFISSDDTRSINIDTTNVRIVEESVTGMKREYVYNTNSLYMFNRHVFEIHWKEWISFSGYTLRIAYDS